MLSSRSQSPYFTEKLPLGESLHVIWEPKSASNGAMFRLQVHGQEGKVCIFQPRDQPWKNPQSTSTAWPLTLKVPSWFPRQMVPLAGASERLLPSPNTSLIAVPHVAAAVIPSSGKISWAPWRDDFPLHKGLGTVALSVWHLLTFGCHQKAFLNPTSPRSSWEKWPVKWQVPLPQQGPFLWFLVEKQEG